MTAGRLVLAATPIGDVEDASPRLRRLLAEGGYAVRYREFDGPHTVPPAIAAEAVDWLLGRQG